MSGSLLLTKRAKSMAAAAAAGYGTYLAYLELGAGEEDWTKAGIALDVSNKNKKQLYELFDKIDLNRNGKISFAELQIALHKEGLDLSLLKVKAMINAVDENNAFKIRIIIAVL